MRGDLYNGWAELAGDFPPSVNTDSDSTGLKPFESPACYGADCQASGYLKTGSILAGTTRHAPTKTLGTDSYLWYYDRLWRNATGTATLTYGARHYDSVYVPQGFGKVIAEQNIVTFMPALSNDMWVLTATGSQMLTGATNATGQFALGQFMQEAYASTATFATTVAGVPHFANEDGVFSWNGQDIKELTRAVRTSLGSFTTAALTADYSEKFLIGAAKYVIDVDNGKLFDYGTEGFLFTSRPLTSDNKRPFQVDGLAINLEYASDGNDVLKWESKMDDDPWYEEPDVTLRNEEGERSRIELAIENSNRHGRKFAIRITTLPSFIKIENIQVMVAEFAQES